MHPSPANEVARLLDRLSRASPCYRWSATVLLSYVTMKAAFNIFILNLATAEVPFHCAEVLVDNRTVQWADVNSSSILPEANFSIASYTCQVPRFRTVGEWLIPLTENYSIETIDDKNGKSSCRSWTYQPSEAERQNMLMEYDFVCDRAYLADRMQTIMQAGIFVSCCFAPLADAFGRKFPFILFVYIDLTSTVLAIFVRNLWAQMVLRFFMGFGSPAVLTGVAYLMELVSEDFHALHGNFYWILWVVGYTASGVIAYLVLQWRLQMIVVALIIATGYASYPWTLVESPKWLHASGRHLEAKNALRRLFRRHGVEATCVDNLKVFDAAVDEQGVQLRDPAGEDASEEGAKEAAATDRLKQPSSPAVGFRQRCLSFLPQESLCQVRYLSVEVVFTILFVANAMSYFSSSFRRDFITKNPYLNVVISGALEFPAAVVAWLLTDRCGRRISNILLLIPAGLLLMLVPYVPQADTVTFGAKSCCALFAKFLVTVSFNVVLIFGSESLPTTIRATSFILASQVMRLGQTLAPELTSLLASAAPALPNLFYGGFCVASGLLLLLLPETHNVAMPDTIADMAGLRLPRICCWRRQSRQQRNVEARPVDENVRTSLNDRQLQVDVEEM